MTDLVLPHLDGATPWSGLDRLPRRPDEFTFALLSDRTGAERPGVFERGIEVLNLLRPDFVVQIGDVIQGYTDDPDRLAAMWAEADAITGALDVPLFRVPGNHDISNAMMHTEWLRRHGATYYHFRYRDVLFVVLDTQDPPPPVVPFASAGIREGTEAAQRSTEAMMDWNGTMPVNLGEEQAAWAEAVVRDHPDVRWTFVLQHMPIWQGDAHPVHRRLLDALGGRPATFISGHVHNYRRLRIDGIDHIRLGPTGGLWVLSGDDGNFDHVTLVSVGAGSPAIANVVLDGVLGVDGGAFRVSPRFVTDPA